MNSSVRSEGIDPSVVSSRHVFRGIEYVVTLMIDSDKEIFVLEVEDRLTSDQWRGQFDARCKLKVKHISLIHGSFLIDLSLENMLPIQVFSICFWDFGS